MNLPTRTKTTRRNTAGTGCRILFLVCLCPALALAADPQPVPPSPWSFEDGLPAGIRAERGQVSASREDCQDGMQALRWEFRRGDRLILPTGPLGNIGVWTGYGGYSRSAFEMRIRTLDAPGDLVCRFLAGGETGASFHVPLVFDGWQRVCYHLSWKSKLERRNARLLAATDTFVIEAPDEGQGGVVYLDVVSFNKPLDFRRKSAPIHESWQAYEPDSDPTAQDLLGPPTEDEMAAIALFLQQDRTLYGGSPATAATVAGLEKKARDGFGLERLGSGRVAGRGLAKWQPLTSLMQETARHWLHTDEPRLKTALEEVFFLANDFLRQQGGVAQGAIQGMNWYGGRHHADACYIMREPLRRSGRLDVVERCLRYNWGYRGIFKTGHADTHSMDYFYINARYLFKIALMQGTANDIVVGLRAFRRRFSRQLVDTIKPDGSLYHHGFHYFAYAGGASREMARQMALMAPTVFRVTPAAYTKVKLAFMNMRWYANVRDLPMTLHGRHPGRQRLYPDAFLTLAEAGRPCHDGDLDPDVTRAALRLAPELAQKPPLNASGLTPEHAPTGHLAMPFAGLGSQRRAEWLAMVRGYGRYLAAQESYSNANRHGLFFGNGYLDILGSGTPVTLPESGCRPNQGWDWRYLDGTTAINMPLARMANGHGTMSERSAVTFVGGLSNGRNGLFVMPLRSSLQYRKAMLKCIRGRKGGQFRADKTFFFFENRIVCLGSGIALQDSRFPVHTTLFQKFLPAPASPDSQASGTDSLARPSLPPTIVNGEAVTDLPFDTLLPTSTPSLLIDPQRTGYFLPAGQSVRVVRRHQASRDGHDKKDTEGDYALAWLDHGLTPANAVYHYATLIQTTPDQLTAFAAAMASERTAPYTVLRQDASAHVVRDRGTQTWGAVFFEAQQLEETWSGPLRRGPWRRLFRRPGRRTSFAVKAVDRPCLVMQEDLGQATVRLTVADPDLHLDKHISQPTCLTLTLRGRWQAAECPGNLEVDSSEQQDTVLTLTCVNGESYQVDLARSQRH